MAKFRSDIVKLKTEGLDVYSPITLLSQMPPVLQALGMKNHRITISPRKLKEAALSWKTDGGKHGIPEDVLKELPRCLHDPIMVFTSKYHDRLVVMTELQHDGKYICALVVPDHASGRNRINAIASIHPREIGEIEKWIKGRLLKYVNKKKSKLWAQIHGLRIPVMCTSHNRSHNNNILHEEYEVKQHETVQKSLRSVLWLLRNPSVAPLAADIKTCSNGREQHASDSAEVILEKGLAVAPELFKGLGTSSASGTTAGIAFHNTLHKSKLPSDTDKLPEQNDLNKAHVAEYDRVTASGALAHVMAHEDSRGRQGAALRQPAAQGKAGAVRTPAALGQPLYHYV